MRFFWLKPTPKTPYFLKSVDEIRASAKSARGKLPSILAELLKHPALLLVVGFSLTGLIGSRLSFDHDDRQRSAAVQHDDVTRARDSVIKTMDKHRQLLDDQIQAITRWHSAVLVYSDSLVSARKSEPRASLRDRYLATFTEMTASSVILSADLSELLSTDFVPYVIDGHMLSLPELLSGPYKYIQASPLSPSLPSEGGKKFNYPDRAKNDVGPPPKITEKFLIDVVGLDRTEIMKRNLAFGLVVEKIDDCLDDLASKAGAAEHGRQLECDFTGSPRKHLDIRWLADAGAVCYLQLIQVLRPNPINDFDSSNERAAKAIFQMKLMGDACSAKALDMDESEIFRFADQVSIR